MTDVFNERDLFGILPPANAIPIEYSHMSSRDSVFDCLTDPLQMTPNTSYSSWVTHENALGLYGTCEFESDWTVNLFSHLPATNTSNQADIRFSNASPSHQPFPSTDSVMRAWQPPASHCPLVHVEAALSGVGRNFVPHSFRPTALPDIPPVQPSTARSPSKQPSVPRSSVRSIPSRSLRHMPYAVSAGSTRRSTSPAFVHQCQWSDDARSCGMFVMGTKNAIGRHLQEVHATRLTADKTLLTCRWDECRKSMRRESIARHILTVHMQDKAHCPDCGSQFARVDSLKRHQRMQCPARGDASNAGGVDE